MLGFLCFAFGGSRAGLRAPDRFGVVLAVAITTWIAFEALLNMATVTNTLPIAGVPLPFFSYGGTAGRAAPAAGGPSLGNAPLGPHARRQCPMRAQPVSVKHGVRLRHPH